ncbi:hypothetical protein [Clostridium sp.]|uniref:hypothetical protein n=1 Tax=Clostridium sp. TaxID=1506 RepID=UPI002903D1E3|nr:hypothetical protein [Clostridium sp.]MDU7259496.1 hypothetical protein [Clostridium butyricum]MDU1069903.1 hypothetical protein [Clostridium sp.]MDU2677791.1 hypothetical protein [Clostridium sp.]MDU4213817.1 hypothetical protein [Clostridium sp.]MDU5173777.1 hypothetical protein [Clostridium sp.]
MMKFDVVINYKGKEYVKLNEALGQANILGLTSKQLKETLKPLSTKLKGLGNTLYILKANVTNEPTQVDEEVVKLRKQKAKLLEELAMKNEVIDETYKVLNEIIDRVERENKDLKEQLEKETKKLKDENRELRIEKELYEKIYNEFMKRDKDGNIDLEIDFDDFEKNVHDICYELSKLIFVDCEPDIYDEVFSIYYQYKPSNEEELRKNYRQLVRKYHPDVYGDDRIFKQLETIKEFWEQGIKY